MNANAATRKRKTKGTANIIGAGVNVAVPHSLPSSNLKLAPKLEPAQVALELLPQDLHNHIASHTARMINLFGDVNKKWVGLSNFSKTENENNINIPTYLKSMKNHLSGSKAVKGTEMYKQLETRMDTLLQNYKVQATEIVLEVTKFEVEHKNKMLIYAMHDCVSELANTLAIIKLETENLLTGFKRK